MKEHPPTEPVTDEFLGSPVRVEELVCGVPLRFTIEDSGRIVFGSREVIFRDIDIPDRFRHATQSIRKIIDRSGLTGMESDAVFYGIATSYNGVIYNWNETPSFLGHDIYHDEEYLPPERVHKTFDRMNIEQVPVISHDVKVDEISFPESSFRDDQVHGLVFRRDGKRKSTIRPEQSYQKPRSTIEFDELKKVISRVDGDSFEEIYNKVLYELFRRYDILDNNQFRSEVSTGVRRVME